MLGGKLELRLDSADRNAFIVEVRRRVALLEKLIAEYEKQSTPER
jgi:hypothetical protein